MFSSPLSAAADERLCLENGVYEEIMEQGLEAFYRSDWQRARICFDQMQNIEPSDARALFFASMIPFWSYFFVESGEEASNRFMDLSESAIELATEELRERPEALHLISMLSALHGYRSLVASRENRVRTAFRSGRAGFSYTQRLMKMEKSGPEINIGVGIYHYMAGSVPGALKWLAAIFGLKGDRETGFEYLKMAADTESALQTDARMILGYLYNREGDHEQALAYTDLLAKEYEENIIFLYIHAETLERSGRVEQAVPLYRQISGMNHTELYLLVERSSQRLEELSSESLESIIGRNGPRPEI